MNADTCARCSLNRSVSPVARIRPARYLVTRNDWTEPSCAMHLASIIEWLTSPESDKVTVQRLAPS